MPPNDVIQRTQQLRDELRKLAESSEDAGTRLGKLESILNGLRDFNFRSIKEASSVLANFNQNARLMSNDVDSVNKVTKAFADLVSTMQKADLVKQQFSSYGKSGVATKRYTAAMGLGDEAQMNEQRTAINRQKQMAEEAKRGLANLETYWKEATTMADKIVALRQEFFRRLLGAGGLPLLGAGTIGDYGTMFMGAGENLTNYIPPTPPPQLPPGRIPPQLPAGQLPNPNTPLLTAGTGFPMPVGTIHMPAYTEMLQNAEYIATEAPSDRFRRLTTVIDDAVAQRVETEAEEFINVPIDRGINAEGLTNTPGGGTRTGRVRRDLAGNELTGMWAGEEKVNIKNLQSIGLTANAAANLEKTLTGLGMTSARVTGNVTELSTGIQTVSFQADAGGGAIKNLTAHLDRNGNVLADTQKRFRSFGSAVMRDVVEVLKWTIAITAIYTPIRKLGEVMDEMKKIQLDLVDVQIVLGNSTKQFGTVLEATSRIATETSSSLEGVIQGYSLAAAAASSAGNETQRTVATEKLLKDSMVLSKLANIDQKQALDTLVGSLSQLGLGLTDGTKLLDSWVAVSKKANVSVKDMATSFTIVGSAAQEVGVDFNQLNALIGALAQSTNLSSDELGNAIRGIIASMQTDKTQQAFAEYGIATKTVSGNFRDLMDILAQLKQMSESGILDEKAMGNLTQIGGGGARRGAQLSALVKNLDTVMNLVTVSENASGDAAQAMSLEMGTLDAATTRLNNAFSELAVTLGGEGGFLSFLTAATNLITSLVKGVKELSSVLKIAAPILGTFMLAKGVLGTQQGASLLNQNIPTKVASVFTAPTSFGVNPITGTAAKTLSRAPLTNWLLGLLQGTNIGSQQLEGGTARTSTLREFFTPMYRGLTMPFAQMYANRRGLEAPPALPLGLGKTSIATLLGPLLIAASNIGQPGGGARAGVGAIGGLLGALTGNPLWATVGSVIATGFYDKFLTFSDDMATVWAQKVVENTKAAEESTAPEDALARLNREARESMSAGEIFKVNLVNLMMNTWSKLPWSTQGGKQVTPEETALGLSLLNTNALDPETKDKIIKAYNQMMVDLADSTELPNLVSLPQQDEIARLAASASTDVMNKAIEQISEGASGSIQSYLDAKTLAQKIGSTVTGLLNVQKLIAQPTTIGVGEGAQTIAPPANFTPMTTQEATKFISGLNSEEASAIVSYYTEIGDLLSKINALNDLIAGQTGGVTPDQQKLLDSYAETLKTLPEEFVKMMQAVEQGSRYRQIGEKMLPTIDLPEMTPEQYQQVVAAAQQYWTEYLKASGLTDEEIKQWIDAQNEQIVTMQQSVTPFRTNIPQQYFAPAMEQAGITGQMPQILDWSQYTGAQYQQALSQYPQFVKAIQQAFASKGLNWQPQEEDAMVMLNDKMDVNHLDFGILHMLMRDLIDVEKDKGLQGMYNLPSGATFYVPVTAYELHKQTQAGIAGGGGLSSATNILQMILDFLMGNMPTDSSTAETGTAVQQHIDALAQHNFFGGGDLAQSQNGQAIPVTVTNWLDEAYKNQVPGTFTPVPGTSTPVDPFQEFLQNNETNFSTKAEGVGAKPESPLPSWLQWTEDIAPAINKLSEWLGKFFTPENLNNMIGANHNPTSYAPTENPTVSTALNLAVDSTIRLTVDGRTLATIIKPYLYEDLIRFNTSTTTSISKSVIA